MTVLLREAIGDRLRHARTNQRRTLRDISRSARVSLGYLSEVERGQKEASSELLSAICDALELPLSELMFNVASDIATLDTMALDGAELDRRELDRPVRREEKAGDITISTAGVPPSLRTTIAGPKMSAVFAA